MNSHITDDLMDQTIYLKTSIDSNHERAIRRLSESYSELREILSEISMNKIEILDKFKEKLFNNVLSMQQFYGIAMGDILECIF